MNPSGELKQVALTDILLSPTNPRKTYRTPDWPDFVASIHTQGVIEPGIARPHPKLKGRFELVAGSRRFLGSQEAARPTMPIIIRDLTDDQVVEIQQIENLQRENLSALEEAEGYQSWIRALQKANEKITVEDAVLRISGRVHRKRSAIFARLALLKTSAPVQEALAKGRLDPSAASLIATVPDPQAQARLLKDAGDLSVRQISELIAEEYRQPLKDAPFDRSDPKLGIDKTTDRIFGGACTDCPHRTGNMVDRYPELAKTPQICTSPECYRLKVQANTDRVLNRAKAAGRTVIAAKDYDNNRWNYETAGNTCYADDHNRSYGALAKKAGVTPAVTVDRDGKTVEVFSPAQKSQILKACKIRESSGGMSASDRSAMKRRQQKEKEFLLTAQWAIGPIVMKLLPPIGVAHQSLFEFIARAAYDTTDISRHDFTAKRRGISTTVNESRNALHKWFKEKHEPREYAEMALDLLVFASWNGGGWHETKWDKDFVALCKLAGGTPEQLAAKAEKAAEKGGFWDKKSKYNKTGAKATAEQNRKASRKGATSKRK